MVMMTHTTAVVVVLLAIVSRHFIQSKNPAKRQSHRADL